MGDLHLCYGPKPYHRKGWTGWKGRQFKHGWFETPGPGVVIEMSGGGLIAHHMPFELLAFCGLRKNAIGTEFQRDVTCHACLVMLDRAIERGEAEVVRARDRRGPFARLLREPTPDELARQAIPVEFRQVAP